MGGGVGEARGRGEEEASSRVSHGDTERAVRESEECENKGVGEGGSDGSYEASRRSPALPRACRRPVRVAGPVLARRKRPIQPFPLSPARDCFEIRLGQDLNLAGLYGLSAINQTHPI